MRPERHPRGPRPPSYLCRAPHRRSRAARTRARRRRARRALSGAAAAAAPGGRACCSQAAARGPGRACSRRSPCAASLAAAAAAAAWASATSRASPAAARRRLAAPSRQPPLAGPHEAGGGLSGPIESAAAGAGRGGAGRGGGEGAGLAPPGTVAKDPHARAHRAIPCLAPAAAQWPAGKVAKWRQPLYRRGHRPGFWGTSLKCPSVRSWTPPTWEPRGRMQCLTRLATHCDRRAGIVGRRARYTPPFIHSVHHLLKARHMPDTVLGAGDAT